MRQGVARAGTTGLPVLIGAILLVGFLATMVVAHTTIGSLAGPVDLDRASLRRSLERGGAIIIDGEPLDARALRRVYRARGFAPAWSGGAKETAGADLLLDTLRRAEEHGLDPARYHRAALSARTGARDARAAMEHELLLTDALLRYATHVRVGRLRPEIVEADWATITPSFDAAAAISQALRTPGELAIFLTSLPPPSDGYHHLMEARRRYRVLAASSGWAPVPPGPVPGPGERGPRADALRDRLALDGNLADVDLAAAVRRFQARHGLAIDGLVGPATSRELNVPAARRVEQIDLNLERWRWIPRDFGPRYIVVNAAAGALELVEHNRTVLASRVVVGDREHPTPVLQTRLDGVIFNPPWNIPTSIALQEIVPRLRQEPRYLGDQNIVILERRTHDPFGLAVDWSAVPHDPFPFRLQQLPGSRNPLGRLRFNTGRSSSTSTCMTVRRGRCSCDRYEPSATAAFGSSRRMNSPLTCWAGRGGTSIRLSRPA